MALISYLILAIASFTPSTFANSTCPSINTIFVDIHNRTVDGGTEVFQYGSFIGVGEPFQNQSSWPSLRRNETSFAATDFCSHSNLTNCLDNTGGTVDFNSSSSWREFAAYQAKDSPSIADSSIYGTDDIHLYQHFFETQPASAVTVMNTPVEYALSGDINPGVIGLGSSSTLMQSLVDQNLVPGSSCGLFVGNGMVDAGPGLFNGSLTLGGYDSARMSGTVHTYDMDLSQPDFLPVTIADIILNDPNNSNVQNRSILDNGTSFEVRITTDQYPMRLPAAVTQNFINLLAANTSDSPDGALQATQHFGGTMKFKLSDGFEITLPRETVLPLNGLFPVQETDEEYDGPFYLSTAWLSQVYLTLDYDAKKFHLAQAIMNTTLIIPIKICSGDTPVPHNYGAQHPDFVKYGMAGAVVGGVIGGIAVVIAVTYSFVWWKRGQIAKEQNKRWEESAAWKTRSSDDLEMESLRPGGREAKLPWSNDGPPTIPSTILVHDKDAPHNGRIFTEIWEN